VQSGQDRPVSGGLDAHADAVGRDVHRARGGAEREQRDGELGQRVGQAGQDDGHAQEHGRGGRHQSGAEPGAERTGELHARQRAEGHAQQCEPEGGVGRADLRGDVGDARGPAAEDGAVEGEQCRDGGQHAPV
jgi:hypothetical protein